MDPRPGLAASGSTYHSFNDIELLEPPLGPSSVESRASTHRREPAPQQDPGQTQRHAAASPRRSGSRSRPAPSRRTSNASSAPGVARASTPRRSPRSYPQPGPQRPLPVGYFQFPAPDLGELAAPPDAEPPRPPQTTHYWTSNSTRRLEYAAIDAASRGFRGWLRRHLVPECFVARHVAFDDDSGSVRRYRLELDDDDEEGAEKDAPCPRASRRRKGWAFWPLRRSSTA